MIVGPPIPTPSTLRIGGAFASAISCWRISSSMKARPAPPYSLGQVRPMKPASKSVRCQRRRNSYCSARGSSELPVGFHSRGMFVLSQERTVALNASCSGVSERSISPPEGGRAERLNRGSFSNHSRSEVKAYTPSQSDLDLAAATHLSDQYARPLRWTARRWRDAHVLVTTPRRSPRVAAWRDAGGGARDVGRLGRQHLRRDRDPRPSSGNAGRPHRLAHRYRARGGHP